MAEYGVIIFLIVTWDILYDQFCHNEISVKIGGALALPIFFVVVLLLEPCLRVAVF